MKRILAALFIHFIFSCSTYAIDTFVVKDIRVEGLQRISPGTVFNYFPIKVGDAVTEEGAREGIRALFKTGFFNDVRLERQGNVLIVTVAERPSIATLKITGAKQISEDDLKQGLRETGLSEGRVFNNSLLDKVEQELKRQYFSQGRYAVQVKITVSPLRRNRVDVTIDISEGLVAKIQDINIVGNSVFKDKKLLKLFTLKTAGFFRSILSKDLYSKQKLIADLESLRNFYQNKGYLEFDIESTQVSVTPDKEHIYITVNISEGDKYTVSGYSLSGKLILSEEEIRKVIDIKPGDVFSRRKITEISKNITDLLGNEGYAFANVNPIPDVDKENATVSFTFFIDPSKRVYVRRINFAGNTTTRDEVLRREMRQFEGAWYSTKKLQRSRIRLQRLGYFEDINVESPPVTGSPDQVDINISIKERPTGSILFGVGFSDVDGVLLNANVTERNLFGTGKELSAALNNSQSTTNFNISYRNPYHTLDGISRGFNVFSSEVDASRANTAAYNTKTVGTGVFYGIPISEQRKIDVGLAYESIDISVNPFSAQAAQDFVAENGESNDLIIATLGWSHDTLDSFLFPSSGSLQRLFAEVVVPGSDLEYYKLTYTLGHFVPLSKRFVFKARGELGYGDGYGDTQELPFYKNFFAGGSRTVRGYDSRSLGPRDTIPPFDPIGGSKRALAKLEFLFPLPGQPPEKKSMRLSLFLDGGMVYGSDEKMDLGELRYSTGLAFNWFTPVGPLSLSIAKPLNDKPGDDTKVFQFTLGVPFK